MENSETSADPEQLTRLREIGLRSKKRTLRDREYKACMVVTGGCAYAIFSLSIAALGLISIGAFVVATIQIVLAAGLGYTIYSIWRPKTWQPLFAAAPPVVFALLEMLSGGWSDKPFWLVGVALAGIYYLDRVRKEIAELPV